MSTLPASRITPCCSVLYVYDRTRFMIPNLRSPFDNDYSYSMPQFRTMFPALCVFL